MKFDQAFDDECIHLSSFSQFSFSAKTSLEWKHFKELKIIYVARRNIWKSFGFEWQIHIYIENSLSSHTSFLLLRTSQRTSFLDQLSVKFCITIALNTSFNHYIFFELSCRSIAAWSSIFKSCFHRCCFHKSIFQFFEYCFFFVLCKILSSKPLNVFQILFICDFSFNSQFKTFISALNYSILYKVDQTSNLNL